MLLETYFYLVMKFSGFCNSWTHRVIFLRALVSSPDPLGQVSYCHHFASLFCHLSIYLLSFDISSKITGLILTYLTRSVITWPSLNIVSDQQPLDNRNIHSEIVGSIFTKGYLDNPQNCVWISNVSENLRGKQECTIHIHWQHKT